MPKRFVYLFLFLFLLSGCTVGPKYTPPEMEIPCDWNSCYSEGMNRASPDTFIWWESLQDPTLNYLITTAAQQNLDLSIAASRILQARAERKAQSFASLPHIDGSLSGGHVHYSRDALKDVLCNDACHKRDANFFEIGFDADWEIDLFGMRTHEMNASKARMRSAQENYNDMWVSLSAEVARNYIELRGQQESLKVLHKNIESQKDNLGLIQTLLDIGIQDTVDYQQGETQLALLFAKKPLIEMSIDKAIYRLSILLGYPPNGLCALLQEPGALPCIPCDKPIGVPSELLRRRPDIRRAEWELAGATEEVGVAVASLFPRLSLKGFIGDISTRSHSLFSSTSNTWFACPQLLIPIFNSSLIEQDITINKIKRCEAFYTYHKTVLLALEEAENAIGGYHYALERNNKLNDALQLSQSTTQFISQLYEQGIKDYFSVLTSTQTQLDIEESLIQSKMDLLTQFISIYKALGGSWNISECVAE